MWTNVQSRSREVQNATDGTVVPATRVDVPAHGMTPSLHAVPIQSLFVPTLQDIVKSYINVMNNVVVMITIFHPLHLNLHPGMTITTTNRQLPTSRSIMTTPPILIKAPEKVEVLAVLERPVQVSVLHASLRMGRLLKATLQASVL